MRIIVDGHSEGYTGHGVPVQKLDSEQKKLMILKKKELL